MNLNLNILVLFIVIVLGHDAFAHGDVHQQIQLVTGEILKDDHNVSLLLKRAELERMDGDFLAALRDCDKAHTLEVTNIAIHFTRAKILLDQGKSARAAVEFDKFLKDHPLHVDALIGQARASVQAGEIESAERYFRLAIEHAAAPEPDWYFECARMLERAGRGSDAVAVLDDAGRRFGGIVSIELLAIEFETKLHNFDRAVTRLDKIIAQSSRKESWLGKRAQILELAGRFDEARHAYVKTLAAIHALPTPLRMTATTKELESSMTAALQRLNERK